MMFASPGGTTPRALISAVASAFCASAPGKLNPTERPPPIAADCFRNFLRAGSNLRVNVLAMVASMPSRSEEHTSELQSRLHLVCRLLLEKKKKENHPITAITDSQ